MNLGLFLLLCNKTFCYLFLLQITAKSQENPEILYKRTFVSTAPSSTERSEKTGSTSNADGLIALLHTVRHPQHFHIWEC